MKLLYLLIFLIPFQNHPMLSRAIVPTLTPIKMVGFAVLGYAAYLNLSRYLHLQKPEKTLFQEGMFLFFFFSQILLALFWYPDVGGDAMKSIISFLIFYSAITTIVKTEEQMVKIFWACSFAMAWSSIYMFKEYVAFRDVYNGFRPRGSFGDSNYFSIAALMVVPMATALFKLSTGKKKILALVFLLSIIGGVMVGQSRGGMIGLVIIAANYFRSSKAKLHLTILMLCALPVGAMLMPANFWERIQNFEVEESTDVSGDAQSNKRRVELPRAGILMFKAKPILGVGLGNYKVNSARYNPILKYIGGPGIAHNTYVEMLGEGGIVGFTLFSGTLVVSMFLFGGISRRTADGTVAKESSKAMLYALFAYSFSAIFLTAQYSKFYWLLIFLGVALVRIVARDRTEKGASNEDRNY